MKLIIDLTENIGVEHDGENKETSRIVLTDVTDINQKGSRFYSVTYKKGGFAISKKLIKSIQIISNG